MSARQFERFHASSLYCQPCGKAMPVTERLLLVLPEKELYEYLCTQCGESVGSREVTATEKLMAETVRQATRRTGVQVRIV
ncbi:MAG: hypothetical protein M3463_17835 [Verrucomicrobiota bacterium]|nr:hypothetical protein [Verrucomicrobiota bacterium]